MTTADARQGPGGRRVAAPGTFADAPASSSSGPSLMENLKADRRPQLSFEPSLRLARKPAECPTDSNLAETGRSATPPDCHLSWVDFSATPPRGRGERQPSRQPLSQKKTWNRSQNRSVELSRWPPGRR